MASEVSRFPTRRPPRRGASLMLVLIVLTGLIVCTAYAINIGSLCVLSGQIQAAADASAIAAAGGLFPGMMALELDSYALTPDLQDPRRLAVEVAQAHLVSKRTDHDRRLTVDANAANALDGEVVLGYLDDPLDHQSSLVPSLDFVNAVSVTVALRADNPNRAVTSFFGGFLLNDQHELTARAVAVATPATLLPLVIHEDHWATLADGGAGDHYGMEGDEVIGGGDGIPELVLFGDDWQLHDPPPGAFGLLALGGRFAPQHLMRQIAFGPTLEDLEYHGGALHSGSELPGRPGLPAVIESAIVGGRQGQEWFDGILGQPRYIALYSSASGGGANARFTISRFVGVRVMAAELRGGGKQLVVQPLTENDDPAGVRLVR